MQLVSQQTFMIRDVARRGVANVLCLGGFKLQFCRQSGRGMGVGGAGRGWGVSGAWVGRGRERGRERGWGVGGREWA